MEFLSVILAQRSQLCASPALLARLNAQGAPYGLSLSMGDLRALSDCRAQALQNTGRVEFGEGILEKIVAAFVDSPYLFQEEYTEALARLQEMFYRCKSETHERISDSALLAAKRAKEQFPERKVVVIDSLCASLGEGLYVYYAVQYQKSGMTLEETAQKLEKIKQQLCHYFTVDDLHHLHRGGRVSKTAAIVGSVLGIKPVLHVDEAGRLIPIGKVRGRKQSLNQLVARMKEKTAGVKNEIFFVSHGDCLEDAEYVADLVKKECGVKKYIIGDIGPVIGTHSGPGTVALFFLGESRTEKQK